MVAVTQVIIIVVVSLRIFYSLFQNMDRFDKLIYIIFTMHLDIILKGSWPKKEGVELRLFQISTKSLAY